MNTLGKYNMIQKIKFKDGSTSFYLTDKDNKEYDCDLRSDFWFNEFDEIKFARVPFMCVSTLQEILDFLDKEQIRYKEYYKDGILRIGGEHDMHVYGDLSYVWDND